MQRIKMQAKDFVGHEDAEAGYVDDEEEMPMTERELAEDAQWKIIQKNTFTRWTNEHLKKANKQIVDLQNDFSDGLRLVSLIEVLSQHQFKHVNKRPNFRTQKLENVTMVLKFLEEYEGLKIVNIDSSDIVDCRLKLILGLIWTLILHYSISMPMWEGEEELPQDEKGKGPTPKQRMMSWLNTKMPDRPIRNFTTDWNDGVAIGALVDAFAPGLCPDWPDWPSRAPLTNAKEAMDAAEQWLDVPQLIKPEEMINPKVDDKAMMTYLSQFPNAKLKPGAPLRPRTNPARVRAYGPGLEKEGNAVGAPAMFTVETFSAGRGNVEVVVINPKGQKEPCNVVANNDKNLTYSCVYLPTMEGQYRVIVKFAGKEVPHSPFGVTVQGMAGDSTKVTAQGPGIESRGNLVGKRTQFNIFLNDAGSGNVDCVVLDPNGRHDAIKPLITRQSEGVYLVEYTPKEEGLHSVNVFFAGKLIPNSPFGVGVGPTCSPAAAFVTGRGVQPRGIRVKETVEFFIHTRDAGEGEVNINIAGPGGAEVPFTLSKVNPFLYKCVYTLPKTGKYIVTVVFGSGQVQRSPFKIEVGPVSNSKIRAYGPGLSAGIVNKPAVFTVETNDETGNLGFSIEGPSEARIECKDNGDGSAVVTYWPTLPGEYAVHVTCNNDDIPLSPYMADIVSVGGNIDPSRVKVFGPGVESNGVKVSVATEFTVDIRDAGGPAPVVVTCADNFGNPVPVEVKDKGDGTFSCRYTVASPSKHTIYVTYGGINVNKSPFIVNPKGAATGEVAGNVRVFGPGFESATRNQPTYFTIDCKKAGLGAVGVQMADEGGRQVGVDVKDNGDDTFTVKYTPQSTGTYTTTVFFNSKLVVSKKVVVIPDIDISGVRVENMEPRVYKEAFARFLVDATPVDKTGRGTVKGIVTSPKGQRTACKVENAGDGTYRCHYTPLDEGNYKVEVMYEGIPLKGSPFAVQVAPGCDPSRVKAYGPGLQGGMVGLPQKFTIDLAGAGKGGIGLAIEGPGDAEIKCQDNKNGTCSVEYTPVKPGKYDIFVKFNDTDIPGSPFHIPIRSELDPSKVKCMGPGLNSDKVRAEKPAVFVVDASEAGDAPLLVTVTDAHGTKCPVTIAPHSSQEPLISQVTYTPHAAGPAKVEVLYSGVQVPGSPFVQHVRPVSEPDRVVVTGDGVSPSQTIPLKASVPAQFTVDATEAGDGELQMSLKDPQGISQTMNITKVEEGMFHVNYQTFKTGLHTVQLKYNDKDIHGSPFGINAVPTGNANRCKIQEGAKPVVKVNEECVITVLTSEAGEGRLMCHIVSNQGVEVDTEIEDNGNGTTSIYYTPKQLGDHTVEMRFGGQPVPSGCFKQKVVKPGDPALENGENIRTIIPSHLPSSTYHPVDFKLPIGPDFGAVDAFVRTPSGKQEKPKLINNKIDDSVTVQYQPTEKGMHELTVTYKNQGVPGSPFRFYVDSAATGKVHAYGPGLSHGKTGEKSEFTIVTRDSGAGGLTLAIEGPSKVEIQCRDNNDGTCSVSYLPLAPGDYTVILKFMDRHIPGSPFTAKVTGEPLKRSQVSVGTTSDISLKIPNSDIGQLSASVVSPSGKEEPCILKKMPNDHLGISFTPREVGEHLVNVYKGDQHIPHSPFHIPVSMDEIGDASKVRVYGEGIEKGMANETTQFTVDTRQAGFGGLSLSIEGPSKADIECNDNHDGTCTVMYRPTEPGTYHVNVKYADRHVPGSPFTVRVGGEPSERLMERILRQRDAAEVTQIGSHCELSLTIPGTNPLEMAATVTSPSGNTEDCDIVDIDEGHYSINFVPKEMGVHTVAVKHRNEHITGSPFQFTVGPITDGGTHKVRAAGPGLQSGTINTPNTFNIITREAGAGGLSIAIEGPTKAEIDFEDQSDGSCGVSYTVTESGDYLCSIKFNDDHIPGSPFRIYIGEPDSDGLAGNIKATDAKTLSLGTGGDKGLQVGRPAAFTVNYKGAKAGKMRAYVKTPSGTQDEAVIQTIDTDQYAVRFIPRENGPHLIYVLAGDNDTPIPGSPFRFLVGQYDADPGMVHATGDGLTRGIVMQKNRFFVNTVNAGSGALNVTVDGPSKVQLNCHEKESGYEFTYVPTEPGEYVITVKYGGNYHIVGSPFHAHVTGSGHGGSPPVVDQQSHVLVETVDKTSVGRLLKARTDSHPERVNCHGLGLKMAYMDRKNQFNIDASLAGMDILLVGVAGPERPCEEVIVKHIGRNQFTVNYNVIEKGTHLLMIKWGDQHVPGSPFIVEVP